jgi:hypothetical protein
VSLDKPRDVTLQNLIIKMATFAEVVNNQSSNKINTDESDSKHEEQNTDYASGDSVKPLFLVGKDVFGSTKSDRAHWLTNVEIYPVSQLVNLPSKFFLKGTFNIAAF